MAIKASDFNAAGVVQAADIIPLVRNNENLRTSPTDIATFIAAAAVVLEAIRDTIGTALLGGQGIDVTVNDPGDTITVATVPDVQSVVSAATVTPTFADDEVKITAQAVALALANPTGTAVEAHGIVIRIKDNGVAQAISYGTQYRALGVTLPTTTVVNKTLYLGMIYNLTDTKWDVVSVAQEA